MAARHDEQEADDAEDRAGRAGGELGAVDEDREHAAAGGAQQVDGGVLEAPVHALGDLAVQVEDVHVEGEVDRAEVHEGAGDDAPPLALRRTSSALMRCSLAERADAAAEHPPLKRLAAAQDDVDPEHGRRRWR